MDELFQRMQARAYANAFAVYNHIELEIAEEDHAVLRLTAVADSCNPYGIIHGGALYTLADSACGTAIHSDGRATSPTAASATPSGARPGSSTGAAAPASSTWTSGTPRVSSWPPAISATSAWTRRWARTPTSRSGRSNSLKSAGKPSR